MPCRTWRPSCPCCCCQRNTPAELCCIVRRKANQAQAAAAAAEVGVPRLPVLLLALLWPGNGHVVLLPLCPGALLALALALALALFCHAL